MDLISLLFALVAALLGLKAATMPVRDSMDDFMAGSSKAGPVDEFCCCRRCGLCSGASD